jgi:3-dehydroquinate synthase
MESISYTLSTDQKVEFHIDDDPNLSWLSQFDSKSFNRMYMVIDDYIDENWGETLIDLLEKHDKEIHRIRFKATEENKSLDKFVELVHEFENQGLNRYDVLIAVGSGVLLDLVGFIASTYMRGIPLILVPTTLIGQVDAATAGKTCVNSQNSKNLVGTLYLPNYVYNNIHFLKTLRFFHYRQGISEIYKYGLLGSPWLLELLFGQEKEPSDSTVIKIINETIRVRMKLRMEDPLASNLGHTFGHAMEKLSGFSVGHGDAVSIGILMAVCFGEKEMITKPGTFDKIMQDMEQLGLNRHYDPEWTVDKIVNLMLKDKKSSSAKINLIMISSIGEPYSLDSSPFYPVERKAVSEFLDYFFHSYSHFAKSDIASFLQQQEKS